MSDFNFEFDVGKELKQMRSGETKDKSKKKRPDKEKDDDLDIIKPTNTGGSSSTPKESTENKEIVVKEGFDVKQSNDERFGGSGSSTTTVTDDVEPFTGVVDWKSFGTIMGLFDYVGGVRPVKLNRSYKKSSVSGLIDPVFKIIVDNMKDKFLGLKVKFPWQEEFEVTEENKVFRNKSSLIRFLMFDSMRDKNGTSVKLGQQWFYSHNKSAISPDYNPSFSLLPNDDTLDIYGLLVLNHRIDCGNVLKDLDGVGSEDVVSRLDSMGSNVNTLIQKINKQEKLIKEQNGRNQVTQTILLLDSMGLLKGGIPSDLSEFVYLLEQNRDILNSTDDMIVKHLDDEKERNYRLNRQNKMNELKNKRN